MEVSDKDGTGEGEARGAERGKSLAKGS